MGKQDLTEQIQLIKLFFKGQEDEFALQWEKGNKSGYIPSYSDAP